MEPIDVNQIMDEIRQRIRAENLSEKSFEFFNPKNAGSPTSAKMFSKASFDDNIGQTHERSGVLALLGLRSSGIRRFLRQAARKIVRCYIEPSVSALAYSGLCSAGMKHFLRRVIRRLISFYVEPVTED